MATTAVKPQLSLHVTIRVAPKDVEAFLTALRPCWAGCASEPECLFFDVFQDPKTPGLFRFVELWSEDQEWFETGMKKQFIKPYYHPYLEITQPMWIAERKMEYFNRQPGWSVFSDKYLAVSGKVEV